jgi:rod shape determining protein RodA
LASLARPAAAKRFDWLLLLSALILVGIGFLSLYSVGLRDGGNYLRKQIAMGIIGVVPFSLFYFVEPQAWRRIALPLYVLNVVVLAAVLFLGTSINGSQRWIDLKFMQFQPSEMAKLLTVVTLASFLASRQSSMGKFSTFALSFAHVAVPAFLIAKQPHYGGAMVLIVAWLCVCVAGNVPIKLLAGSVVVLSVLVVSASQIPGLLHDYHLKRLESMQHEDREGTGYQQERAAVALGVGGLVGDGFAKGRQSLPEQENDFIFSVLGEETGLVGTTLILAAFAFFFYRAWLVMLNAADPYLRMLAGGVIGILAFHTIINIAMVVQILPVVGLWLPFMSAGGTALWLCMACVGLLLRIRASEKPILF